MPSKLGKYKLIRTLGKGAFSTVKLGLNTEDGNYYAVKIHRADTADQSTLEIVGQEAKAVSMLKHPNIVNIVEYLPKAVVEKSNGTSYEVKCVIIDELAEGGELFYYVKNSGHFEERFARYFFRQIIEGLEYVH